MSYWMMSLQQCRVLDVFVASKRPHCPATLSVCEEGATGLGTLQQNPVRRAIDTKSRLVLHLSLCPARTESVCQDSYNRRF